MQFLYFLEGIRNPVLDGFFSAITHLGEDTMFLVIAITVFWCVNKRTGYYLLTVGFFGTVMNQFLKLVCRVPRPWVRDPNFTIVESARAAAGGYSFPSGHTQSITGLMGCLARTSKKTGVRVLCVGIIALTALSRMYLGVHTPADVGTSLVIGTVLVLGFYPLFERGWKNPKLICAVMTALAACSVLYVVFVEVHTWPADIAPQNLAEGLKNGYTLLGCGLAMPLAYYVEQRFINFDERATWQGQCLKLVLGLLLVLSIKAGLKPVLESVLPALPARTVRYFLVVMAAACVWPLTFRFFARIGRNVKF